MKANQTDLEDRKVLDKRDYYAYRDGGSQELGLQK